MVIVIVLIVVIVLVALLLWAAFNGLVRRRNRTQEAWSEIDVELKRRHDLIPNLVSTVEGYASPRAGDLRGGHPGARRRPSPRARPGTRRR